MTTDTVICHAPGDKCLGCPHYYGKSDKCKYSEYGTMTTDLSNKSVLELVAIVDKNHAGDVYETDGTDAAKELARRLEELNKLCKYHEKIEEELQHRSAAHDAKVAAEAKTEALEEARNECARILGDTSEAVEIVDHLWAEYRAKAGRKG